TTMVSRVTGPWQFILLYGIVATVGYTGCSILPVSIHVSRWFPGERGFVSAVAACGFALGYLTFTQIAARTAAAVGWRDTYVVLAGVLAVSLVVFSFTLRNAPSTRPAADSALDACAAARSLDRPAAIRTPAFWALTLGLIGCGFTDFLMTTHLAPYAMDLGMSPAVAANAISFLAAANV